MKAPLFYAVQGGPSGCILNFVLRVGLSISQNGDFRLLTFLTAYACLFAQKCVNINCYTMKLDGAGVAS